MCGIVGVISKNKIKYSTVKKMNDKITHRGPDDAGFLFINNCYDDINLKSSINVKNNSMENIAFSHRRLSIVDTSNLGHQPMMYANYWIVFNGEVYNHIEIRKELEIEGYEFISDSDTEMILAAYDFWGVECQKKFNGMWAFVIYDLDKDEVFISRDRFGIKPLYYYQDENKFIFGSEIKSILEFEDVNTSPNNEYLTEYIKNGAKDNLKETAFKNIFRFEKSSYLLCKASSLYDTFKEEQFWDYNINLSNESFSEIKAREYADKYFKLLKDSVRLRLRADVKVGSALSGGLDSSSIVYLINLILKESGKEELQETFSCVYKTEGTEDCDESNYIDLLAKDLNVNSNQIEPNVDEIIKEHENLIYMMETPPESTCMSGWHTFKKVSQSDVTVTLDGQGADEQLAGYLLYALPYFASLPLLNILNEYNSFKYIPGIKKLLLLGILINFSGTILGKQNSVKLIKRFFNRDFTFNLNEQLEYDTKNNLITLIHYSDHVSMGHSIESRMPFMDYRLVEFLASVPYIYKMHKGWTKYIARLAFDGKLPDEVTWRKDKMGWPIPENFWFRGKLKNWFIEKVKSSEQVKKLNKELDIENELNSSKSINKLIRYLNIAVWEKRFFNEK